MVHGHNFSTKMFSYLIPVDWCFTFFCAMYVAFTRTHFVHPTHAGTLSQKSGVAIDAAIAPIIARFELPWEA